jgi:glycosyltransferase involved in cell wall biosynthesis
MGAELTIVIPAKNEVETLPRLLESLTRQDFEGMRETRVIIADAKSTDGTVEVALSFRGRLQVEVIEGGLPSVGRNAGARLATTPYVLFAAAGIVEDASQAVAPGDDEHLVPRWKLLRRRSVCREQLHAVCGIVSEAVRDGDVHAVRPRGVLAAGRLQ